MQQLYRLYRFLLLIFLFFASPVFARNLSVAENNISARAVYITPDGNTIYVLTAGRPEQLLRSVNSGTTWEPLLVDNKLFSTVTGSLKNNDELFFGGFEESALFTISARALSHLSLQYENFAAAAIDAIYVGTDGKIFMGGQDSDDDLGWLFVGTPDNAGKITWQDSYTPARQPAVDIRQCTLDHLGPLNINAISGSNNEIYLATMDLNQQIPNWGICNSEDNGKSWHSNTTFPKPNAFAVFAAEDNATVFAAGYNDDNQHNDLGSVLYMSIDAGANWRELKFCTAANPFVTGLSGASDATVIYVAATTNPVANTAGGLWRIQQGEAAIKLSLPLTEVRKVACSKEGRVVVAIGNDQSLWISANFGESWHKA